MWRVPGAARCVDPASLPNGAWASQWKGPQSTQGLLSALIEHDNATGAPARLLHLQPHYEIATSDLFPLNKRAYRLPPHPYVAEWREDARAFRDSKGSIRLLHGSWASPGRGRHWLESHVTRVDVARAHAPGATGAAGAGLHLGSNASAGAASYSVSFEAHVPLPFRPVDGAPREEKNFVPWSGAPAARMSYSHYPNGFARHSVFEWQDYDAPRMHTAFASDVDAPFFARLQAHITATRMPHSHVSGGSPAVRYGDGWLAAGHKEEFMRCFHQRADTHLDAATCTPAVMSALRCGAQGREAARNATAKARGVPREGFGGGFGGGGGGGGVRRARQQRRASNSYMVEGHHKRDYFAFLYRFEDQPPYRITHVSSSFKPLASSPVTGSGVHRGVIFPSGLEVWGDGVMLAYGEDDTRALLLVLRKEQIDAMLLPVEGPGAARGLNITRYSYCSVTTNETAVRL